MRVQYLGIFSGIAFVLSDSLAVQLNILRSKKIRFDIKHKHYFLLIWKVKQY